MTKSKELLLVGSLCLLPALAAGQGLDPALLTKPLSTDWPTYSGDYSGKRYSSLSQVNQSNVKNLTLAWVSRMTTGAGGAGGGGRGGGRGFGGGGAPTIVGGEGTGDATAGGGGANIRASVLEVNGTLYLSTPDNAWAVDARDGHELWHYFWKTKGGTHIGNRGLGMWGNWLYLETPDDYLVCLDSKTGKERWHVEIADFNQQYFSTMAPIVIGNHILVGTGDDLDAPGFLQSRDPETGALQWKWYTVPQKKGDPGMETWGDLDTARHGGLGRPRSRPPWRRQRVDSRGLRSRHAPLHFRHRQPVAGLYQPARARRRQPLHLFDRGGERGHRQNGLVFPDVAARHTRLRLHRDPHPGGRGVQRQAAQAAAARQPQRILLHPGPCDRRAPGDQQVLGHHQLGEGPG